MQNLPEMSPRVRNRILGSIGFLISCVTAAVLLGPPGLIAALVFSPFLPV